MNSNHFGELVFNEFIPIMLSCAAIGAVLFGWIPWVTVPWLWRLFKPILIGWLS